MTIETVWPGVTNQNQAQLGAAAAYYSENYDIAFSQTLETGGRRIPLGVKPSPCRFCGRSAPAVMFRKIAHAVPEFIGNGTLVAHYECDECNERFSGFEDDLAKMTLLQRVAGQTIGKGGVPSAKTPQKLSRVDMGAAGLEIKHFVDDPIVAIDETAHTLKISMSSQPYRPLGAYKALVPSQRLRHTCDVGLFHHARTVIFSAPSSNVAMYMSGPGPASKHIASGSVRFLC